MTRIRSVFCLALVFLLIFSFTANHALAKDITDQNAVVTSHDPKNRMSEAKKATAKKPGGGWLWAILGIAVAGGVAALAGGDSGGGDEPTPSTGSFESSW